MLVLASRGSLMSKNKEGKLAEKAISVDAPKAKIKFNGTEYILTKIDFSEEDAKADQEYHKGRGKETRILQDGNFWLLYSKIGG